ncbi:alpha/beta hydrolase family protein [Streptomyces sp. 900116325]
MDGDRQPVEEEAAEIRFDPPGCKGVEVRCQLVGGGVAGIGSGLGQPLPDAVAARLKGCLYEFAHRAEVATQCFFRDACVGAQFGDADTVEFTYRMGRRVQDRGPRAGGIEADAFRDRHAIDGGDRFRGLLLSHRTGQFYLMGADVSDPLVVDSVHPAGPEARTLPVTFASADATLLGVLHLPAGPGPHPVVVLLHGFPGNERNFDLAQALRRAGYATLVFHYRGSWGVGGTWSWAHVLEDSARVVAHLREPETAARHGLDPDRLAVVGHSTGGFAALMTAAVDPTIAAVASVAGFDFGAAAAACRTDPAVRDAYLEGWANELLPLQGTSAPALVAEMESAGESWRLSRLAPLLADRPVLLIGTGRDTVTPVDMHHLPLVDAYQAYPVPGLEHHVFATDHALSDHRIALARTTISFLNQQLKSPSS